MDCGNGERSCHIFVEAKIDDVFVPLDSMYEVYFRNTNGALATSLDVGENWTIYSKQLPKSYPSYFDYAHIRYTNWEKIPVIMPLIKKSLSLFIGDEIERVSLRPYFLNTYKVSLLMIFSVYTLFLLLIFIRVRKINTGR